MTDQELQTKAAKYAEGKVSTNPNMPRWFQAPRTAFNDAIKEAVKYGYELAMAEIKNNPELGIEDFMLKKPKPKPSESDEQSLAKIKAVFGPHIRIEKPKPMRGGFAEEP